MRRSRGAGDIITHNEPLRLMVKKKSILERAKKSPAFAGERKVI
jgi:hypothetical protein